MKTAWNVLRDLLDRFEARDQKITLVDGQHDVAAARVRIDGRWFAIEVRGEM